MVNCTGAGASGVVALPTGKTCISMYYYADLESPIAVCAWIVDFQAARKYWVGSVSDLAKQREAGNRPFDGSFFFQF